MPNDQVNVMALSKAEVRSRVLTGIRGTLVGQIIPALQDANDIMMIHILVRLLDYLDEANLDVGRSLAGRDGLPDSLASELSELAAMPVDGRDVTAIAAALATVAAKADRFATGQPEAAFLRKLADHETNLLGQLDSKGESGVAGTYTKGIVELEGVEKPVGAPPLTEERLTHAMRRNPRFGENARVHSVAEIPGGFNKLTASFVVNHHGQDEAVVIRRDAVPNPTGFSSVDEFATLETVWHAGTVPIAEPLMREPDPSVIGSPFILVRKMPGTTDISSWRGDAEAGRRLAGTLATAIAKLHAIEIGKFLPPGEAVRGVEEYVFEEIDRWRCRSNKWRVRSRPAIDAGFAWMLANIPKVDRRPVFVHGDIGFHNMLMDGGQLTALLDWEFSHIGDPMEDLLYCRPFVSEVCAFEEFVAMYEAAGGAPYDPSVAEYYGVWPSLRNGSGCDALMRVFLENPGFDVKFAIAGTQHVRRYENSVLSFLGTRAEQALQGEKQ